MFIRITLSIFCMGSILGCTHPDDEPVRPNPPSSPQSTEVTEALPSTSLLLETDDVTDYRAVHTYLPPEDSAWIHFGSFRSPKPSVWLWDTPKSTFVTNSYVLPGVKDGDSGVFTITQFETNGGGGLTANIQRWVAKFNTNQGAPIKPIVGSIIVHGLDSTTVEIRGEYMGAGGAWHLPDRTLLVVIFRHTSGVYYFKLLGPTKTIKAHRHSLFTFLEELEPSLP